MRLEAYGRDYTTRHDRTILDRPSGRYTVDEVVFTVDGTAVVAAIETEETAKSIGVEMIFRYSKGEYFLTTATMTMQATMNITKPEKAVAT